MRDDIGNLSAGAAGIAKLNLFEEARHTATKPDGPAKVPGAIIAGFESSKAGHGIRIWDLVLSRGPEGVTMAVMEKRRAPITRLIAAIILLVPAGTAGVIPCVSIRTKPILLHHICGTVRNSAGDPVAKATVTVSQGSKELGTLQTGAEGKFSFEKFDQGRYKVRVEAEGYARAQTSISIAKPTAGCKRSLVVSLAESGKCSTAKREER